MLRPCALLLKFLGERFSEHGWKEITLSADPEEAIRLVQQLHPAVVITDMNWPKPMMSGAQMARVLKENPQTREIPILLLSAAAKRTSEEDKVLFVGIIEKPFIVSELMLAIEMAIAEKYPN
jgi:CheY-like chemotaxis protein